MIYPEEGTSALVELLIVRFHQLMMSHHQPPVGLMLDLRGV